MQVIQENNIKPFVRFQKSIPNPDSREQYENALHRFMKKYQVTEYEELLKLPEKSFENNIIDYIQYVSSSKGYLTQQLSGIKAFCDSNRINLHWDYIYKFKPKFKKSQKDKAYSREQIEKLLEVTDTRTRVITLIYSSTGIRLGALPELKLKHIKKVGELYQFTIYDNEENQEYITFCTPECRTAIDNYLRYREQAGEVLTPESYLIRNEFNSRKPETVSNSEPIADYTITSVMRNALIKAGLRIVKHNAEKSFRQPIKINHGYRKFYTSQLLKSGLQPELRFMLEGHNLKGNDNNYVRVSEKELYNEYIKAVPLLTIDQTLNLKKENQQLKEDISEIELLKDKIAEQNKQINYFSGQLEVLRPFIEANTDIKSCPQCKKMSIRGDLSCVWCGRNIGADDKDL